jgi:chromosome segregation ATPase
MADDDWKWVAAGGVIASIAAALIFLSKKVGENQRKLQRLEQGQSHIKSSLSQIEDSIFEFQTRCQTDIRQILSEHEVLHKRLSQLERAASNPEAKLEIRMLDSLLKATTNDKLKERGAGMYV